MSCPTIKLEISKGYNNGNGGLNPSYTYWSSATVSVINGTSTTPLIGTLELTMRVTNEILIFNLNNFGNSPNFGEFNVDASHFYDAYLAVFTIVANNGECVYDKIISLDSQSDLPCETIISGVGGASGDPSIVENCFAEYILEPTVYGCTNPNADNYNPLATIDDGSCTYENAVYGCTNPESVNYNPLATIDDGSCIIGIYGCTDPESVNYNPLATVDNGTCIYTETPKVLGCTNPLAINYNPLATFNDGNCVFQSGCTNPIADNYNLLAVIDDGSCECGKTEIIFKLNDQEDFYFLNSGSTNCDYYLEYNFRLQIICEQFLDYFQNKSNLTILEILDRLKLYTEVRFEDLHYRQIELDIDPKGEQLYFELSGDTEDCFTVKSLISTELGNTCPTDIDTLFDNKWLTGRLKIPATYLNKFVKLGIYLEGFAFGVNILLDNVKLFSLCYTEQDQCIIIPYNFGFDFNLIEDNKKAIYDTSDKTTTLNTKEVILRVDIPEYVKKDLVKFLNKYEKLYHKIFQSVDLENIKTKFVDTNNVLTDNIYNYYFHLYELYLNSFEYCSAKSKSLDYGFMLQVLEVIGDDWYKMVKQFIPETSLWVEHSRFYGNFLFHQQKFKYRKYLLTLGEDDNEITLTCNLKTLDKCNQTPSFEYQIDTFDKEQTGSCLIDSFITPTNFSSTNYGGGRLLQYNKTTNNYIKQYNYPNQSFEICI